ncbi:lipopolysaccharide biosynthesis protein [Citrobacter amalonaticus]|uniref:lipopolysaccharide biosynthesis protein n=1 Tax=Citrobacter TaxID=544 RepID=UPI0013006725|nr:MULTISPECIES: hypothetical protein [Citrobacter]ELR9585014.1 hypothetical protein [Citrobacter amalonaticus]MDM3520740.1 hypothetical protein [Citrobacter sp. Ca225]MDV2140627.1 hypothetical protein [Citrobacter amalonaticus]MEB0588133.1 hypothetical protein [Citrobacter amalonaticus]QIO40442.1 hypothetical protein HAP28_16190 [Citrobacter sp. Y3]
MKSNAIFSLATTLCKMLSVLLFLAILSHSISREHYNIIVTALFFSQLSSILIDGGVNNEVLSMCNNNVTENSEWYNRLAINGAVRLILYLLCALLLAIYYIYIDDWCSGLIFFASYMSGAFTLIIETYSVKLKTELKYSYDFKLTLMVNVLILLFSIIVYFYPQFLILCLLIPRLLSLAIYKKSLLILKVLDKIDFVKLKDNYIKRKYYSVDSIATSINLQLDSIFLLFLFGKDSYALYQPLNKLYSSCIGLSSAVSAYAIPNAHLAVSKKNKLYILVSFFTFAALIISLGYYLFSGLLVSKMFGSNFSISPEIIELFVVLIFLRYLCASFGSYLMISGEQKIRSIINFIITSFCLPFMFLAQDYTNILMIVIVGQMLITCLYILKIKKKELCST